MTLIDSARELDERRYLKLLREDMRVQERDRYEDSLYAFLSGAWKYIDSAKWVDGWPIEAVAEHLQAVVDGDIRRLIINIPPRCGKSSICSVAFPAWTWAQSQIGPTSGPQVSFLHASYGYNLSERDSEQCRRLIETPWYRRYWGDRFKLTKSTAMRVKNTVNGQRLITSIGGRATGEGGDCFVAGTMVGTPSGLRRIETLKSGDPVFCFNHLQGKVVKSRVIHTKARDVGNLYQIRSTAGRGFVCTGDHPVFSARRGYVPASELRVGEPIIVGGRAPDMAALDMRYVRRSREQTPVRNTQGARPRQSGRLLLEGLLLGAPRREAQQAVRDMRRADTSPTRALLLGDMQGERAAISAQGSILSTLWSIIRHEDPSVRAKDVDDLLHLGVCGRGPFGQDERVAEFQFQKQCAIFQPLPANEGVDSRERRVSLRGMRRGGGDGPKGCADEIAAARPSHRRGAEQQRSGKHDYAVPTVSRETSRWNVDRISDVIALGHRKERVYDIQVERFNNFFADGILVHNCIIVDDPNAANEVMSEATTEATIEWWDGTMSTRLNDLKTGAMVIIQQRLGEDDLTGHVLSKTVGDWQHLCLPMEYEPERSFSTSIGWVDPRTRPGELLWPERFGPDEVRTLKADLGPYRAAGQLQQRPEPAGGGVIKRDWWQPWEDAAFPPMDYIVATLDTAYTEKEINDPRA